MGSSGKGSSGASKQYNYYGSLAALLCHGPIDGVRDLQIEKKVQWPGPLAYGATNPSSISVPSHGQARVHWGTLDQTTPDPLLRERSYDSQPTYDSNGEESGSIQVAVAGNDSDHNHPAYSSLAYLVYDKFLCGKERTTFPDTSIVAWRKPRQQLITGPAAVLDEDNQANPYCILAELFTNEDFGLGLPISAFHLPSWQAAADKALANHATTYISVYLTNPSEARSIADRLLVYCDGWLRADRTTGTCEAGYWPPPEEIIQSSLPTFKKTSQTDLPEWTHEDWADVKTKVTVKYTAANKNWKTVPSLPYESLTARKNIGYDVPEISDRPDITRAQQAAEHAYRAGRRLCQPKGKGKVIERRERVDGVRPGSHINLDIEPETSGNQKQQVCRVLKLTRPLKGVVTMEVETEPSLQPLTVLTLPDPGVVPPEPISPDIGFARLFEVPVGLAGATHNVGILASRPAGLVTGYSVYYDKNPGGYFPRVADGRAFALRGRLATAVASGDSGSFSVQLIDRENRELVSEDPGDAAARNDDLLMVVLKLAAGGVIEADADGKAWIELFSCEAFTSTAPDVLAVTALRSRQGTPVRAFPQYAEVWFIRREALTQITHADFATLTPSTPAYFKLQPSGALGVRPLADCVTRTFTFALNRDLPPTGPDDGITPNPVTDVVVTSGIELIVLRWTPPANTLLDSVRIYESATTTRPGVASFVVPAGQSILFRSGLATTDTRYYWLEPKATNGRLGTLAGPYEGHAGANVPTSVQDALNQLDQDLAQEITNRNNAINSAIAAQQENFSALVEQKKSEAISAAAGDATAKANAAASAAASATAAVASRTTDLETTVNNNTTGLAATRARIQNVETNFADKDFAEAKKGEAISAAAGDATAKANAVASAAAAANSAVAQRATDLEATVNNATTGLSATRAKVSTLTDAFVKPDGTAISRFGAKLTADSGGTLVQTGWEVIAQNGPEGAISAMDIIANILRLRSTLNGTPVIPFQVIDGQVYINTALIKDATITNAMIQSLVADKLSAGTINAAILMTAAKFQSAKMGTDWLTFNPAYPAVYLPATSSFAAANASITLVGVGIVAADAGSAYTNWQYWLGEYNSRLAAYNAIYNAANADEDIDSTEQAALDAQMALVTTANNNRLYWQNAYNYSSTPLQRVFARTRVTFRVTGVVGFSGSAGDIFLKYRINAGSWVQFGTHLIVNGTNPNAFAAFPVTLDLDLSDTVEFYMDWSAPNAANTQLDIDWSN